MLNWIDFTFIALIAVSAAMGFFRGLFKEVASCVILIVAYVAARFLTIDYFGALFPKHYHAMGSLLSYVVVFIVVLLLGYVLMRLLNALIEKSPLTFLNLFLGAIFGLLRGGVLVIAIIFLVNLTRFSQNPIWQQSYLVKGSANFNNLPELTVNHLQA